MITDPSAILVIRTSLREWGCFSLSKRHIFILACYRLAARCASRGTDGAGIPLAIIIDGANRHDMKLLCATLDGIVIARPDPTEAEPQHLCLDAGYDYPVILQEVENRQYMPHIRSRGTEKQEKVFTPGYRARRWVVERTHSWINRSRRLLVRWEKKGENYLAFLYLACAQLIFAKALVFG
jgi:putative transposase